MATVLFHSPNPCFQTTDMLQGDAEVKLNFFFFFLFPVAYLYDWKIAEVEYQIK